MKRAMRTFTSLLLVVVVGTLLGVLVLNLAPAFLDRPATADPAPMPTAAPEVAPASATALEPLGTGGALPRAAVLQQKLDKAFTTDADGSYTGQVIDLATGEVLYNRHGDQASAPASNLKILTAVAALQQLGGEQTLPTTAMLGSDDTVVLVGGGDVLLGAGASEPDATVSRAGLATLAEQTAAALFASGNFDPGTGTELQVVLDDTLFTGADLNPVWDESLMSTSNITAVQPLAMYGARKDSHPQSVRVPDPAMAAATTFRTALAAAVAAEQREADAAGPAGAAADGSPDAASGTASGPADAAVPRLSINDDVIRGEAGAGAETLAVVHSAPVVDQLAFMGAESDNYVAEAMGRLAALAAGRPATFGGATDTLRATASGLGVDVEGMSLADASGLSDRNRLSPRQLTAVIRAAATSPNPDLRDVSYLLPISGATGTLEHRLTSAATRGEIRAKTGTLTGIATLGGTAVTADGRVLAFAFFGHGFDGSLEPARAGLDRAAAVLAGCGCSA
ncbi:D-alanyl-D-alanine carboxypeptidase/D-alanyl-D-alanine-endopeptidase [Arthrobacter sp. JSM 101049]|uniref:D-alanyl-D-alanine carboxypeptidase/D-alanyl-D-alanine endopeptidase n=1 Tax=Arthrobacter sp. JSM 101049 TaxID=929097 RepID=UPI003567D3AF